MIAALMAVMMLAPGCYQPPVAAAVVDSFREPACRFCAGNRGLEYEPPVGSSVTAVAPGVVTFSGVVAGVRYVVIAQTDGRTATYGRLGTSGVRVGSQVFTAALVGTTTERFYFGLRLDDLYIDPAPYLGALRYRPRLVPLDGSAPRRAPPPTLVCRASGVRDRVARR